MAAATASRRGRQAAAAERAAKERRQLIMVVGLAVVLVIVLAVELPGLLGRGGGGGASSTSTTPGAGTTTPTPTPTVATPSAAQTKALAAERRQVEKQKPHDVFAQVSVAPAPNTLGSIPNPPGLHDPFASPSAPESNVAPAAPKPPAPAISGTIVIGKPGAGTVAVHGWIVILASIPTAQGQASASQLQRVAGKAGFGAVSVLNSSNRKPLRGGYWVVYTGPFNTLGQVNANAAKVHSHGFTSAYIRQLIVYKKK